MTAEFRIGQGTLHQAQDFFQLALQILTLRFGWRGSLPAQQDLCDRIIQNTDIAFAHYDHLARCRLDSSLYQTSDAPKKIAKSCCKGDLGWGKYTESRRL